MGKAAECLFLVVPGGQRLEDRAAGDMCLCEGLEPAQGRHGELSPGTDPDGADQDMDR